MTANDIILFFRLLLAEPYQARWVDAPGVSNSTLILASQAQREVAREARWLSGRTGFSTQPNIGAYALPEMVGLKRVYMVSGNSVQRLPQTSIGKMEGDGLRIYDQSGTNFSPQWMTLPPAPYPVANCQIGVGYSALPMFPGTRPEYYLDGGLIGIVPAPSFIYTVVLDTFLMPGEFTSLSDVSGFPMDWKEPIAFYMGYLAYMSDQSVGADSLASAMLEGYAASLAKRRDWAENLDEGDSKGPQILTYRTFYGAGNVGSGGVRW